MKDSEKARNVYQDQPAFCCAITGTNGKSSSAYFLNQIWKNCELKSAWLGTNGLFFGDQHIGEIGGFSIPKLTTPGPFDLHKILDYASNVGITNFTFEASSHAIDQKRLHSVHLQSAAITNVTSDHLDYHKTRESYFETKLKLFKEILSPHETAVVSKDDEHLFFKIRDINRNILSYGFNEKNDIFAHNIVIDTEMMKFNIRIMDTNFSGIITHIFGKIQLKNLLTAISLAVVSGVPTENIIKSIRNLRHLEGRSEYIGVYNGGKIYVDYAHTPDGLKNLLEEFKHICEGRIILVFGCGGDRDKEKRYEMGKYANDLADVAIITDDNPRTENPDEIRKKIMCFCKNGIEIPSRTEAIRFSIEQIRKGDIVLICGKGHEKYQVYGNKITKHDDKEVIKKHLESIKK